MSSTALPKLVRLASGDVVSVDTLLSDADITESGQRTRDFHFNTLTSPREWRSWIDEGLESYKRGRLLYLRRLAESDVEGIDKDEIEERLRKLNHEIRTGEAQTSTRSAEYAKAIPAIREAIAKAQHPTVWSLFALWLPARRSDVCDFEIIDDEANTAAKNYYVRHTGKFVFSEYKTAGVYGRQTFYLDRKSFPFLDETRLEIIFRFLESLPLGQLHSSKNCSRDMRRHVGFSNNELRHFWSTVIGQTGNRDYILKLAEWMSHSPTTALIHYHSADAEQSTEQSPDVIAADIGVYLSGQTLS